MAFFLRVKQLKIKENRAGRQGFMLPFYLFIKVLIQVQQVLHVIVVCITSNNKIRLKS